MLDNRTNVGYGGTWYVRSKWGRYTNKIDRFSISLYVLYKPLCLVQERSSLFLYVLYKPLCLVQELIVRLITMAWSCNSLFLLSVIRTGRLDKYSFSFTKATNLNKMIILLEATDVW